MKLIGNTDIQGQINIAKKSANEEKRSIPHMLLSGAAGCGKTSTARQLAKDTGCKFVNVACEHIKDKSDVLPIIRQMDASGYDEYGRIAGDISPTIVFIDEIHRLSIAGQEPLGILMEEWHILVKFKDLTREEKRSIHNTVDKNSDVLPFGSPQFTLVGATTNDGQLSKPFRDRFKLRFVFTPYSFEESIEIVKVHAEKLKIKITDGGTSEIAKRGRGVPRILVRLLERCRDMVVALGDIDTITDAMAIVTFFEIRIDDTGLDAVDIRVLKALHETGIPVGVDSLAVQLNESPKVLTETIEPYLIQRGLIARGPKGRVLTDMGREYLVEQGHIEQKTKVRKYIMPLTFDRGF